MIDSAAPRVSIGLPVWNGEEFIGAALDSLLGQSFRDLELIVSDNGSTDGTAEICRQRAADDPRVRFYRNDVNIGLQANTQKVLDLARGALFMWASHDDLWHPSYVATMVDRLDADQGLVLAGSDAASIDADDEVQGYFDNWSMYVPGPRFSRVRRLIRADPEGGYSTLIFGLMRTDMVRRLRLATFDNVRVRDRGKYAWDKRALFRLQFEGPFHVERRALYFHRDVSNRTVRVPQRDLAGQVARFRRGLVHCRDVHDYYSVLRDTVRRSHLSDGERAGLLLVSLGQELWYVVRYFSSHRAARAS